jgi:hypothetical protein
MLSGENKLFDQASKLRDGSCIGVFAPQFGPCRGFFTGIKQEFWEGSRSRLRVALPLKLP